MADQALSGVKVIDLTDNVAGPYCTKLFANYGAEVIKIEKPGSGDVTRRLGPFPDDVPHPETSGLFLHLNTSKKSLTLNLESPTGQKILRELVKDADLLVESFPPQEARSMGVTYEEMEKVNPRLVMLSITNFGQAGPYRDYKLTELVLYAMSGCMHHTGVPDREPQKLGLTVIQMLAGTSIAPIALGMVLGARATGEGQYIDFSLMEFAAANMDRGGMGLTNYAYSGDTGMHRAPRVRYSILPNGAYPCADGYVWFTGFTQFSFWPRLALAMGRPELGNDPHFIAPDQFFNPERQEEVDGLLYPWVMEHSKQEIMEKCQAYGFPCTAVNTMEDIFRDPHLQARSFWEELEHPVAGRLTYAGPPFKMSKTPQQMHPAPLLGEHNEEVLCGRLGYAKEDLVRLRERGVI